jgi:hypothetical protein
MNSKFFAQCPVIVKNDFIIQGIVFEYGNGYNTSGPNTCDGSINVTVVGGSGQFTYVWSGPNNYTNTQTTPQSGDIFNLCSGVYSLTVYDTVDGGSSTTTFTVYPPASLSCVLTTTPATIPGGNATLNLTVGGGAPPYTYTVSPPPPSTPTQMTGTFEQIPVSSGVYTVTVFDTSGSTCTTNAVTATTIPVVNLQNFVTSTDTTCGNVNGTITMNVPANNTLNGQPPYSFAVVGPSPSTNIVSTSANATGLAAGTYEFVVTDSTYTGGTNPYNYGGNGIDNSTVVIAPSQAVSFNLLPEEFCWIAPNPTATILPTLTNIVTNGAFTINLYNVAVSTVNPAITIGPINPTSTYTFTNPIPDLLYDIEIVDSLGCTHEINEDFSPGIGKVPTYASDISWVQEKFCNTNVINTATPTLLVTSEKSGTITWSGPTPSSPQPFVGGQNVPVTLPALAFGNYTFTFTDNANTNPAGGCSVSTSVNLSAVAGGGAGGGFGVPTQLNISANFTAPVQTSQTSTNGNISATASGGWGGYVYTINRQGVPVSSGPTASYSIPASEDGNGIAYSVLVTDSEGCTTLSNTFTT